MLSRNGVKKPQTHGNNTKCDKSAPHAVRRICGSPRVIARRSRTRVTGSPPEGPRRDNRHGLMRGVVDNGQALHDPPIRRAIEDEVRGPDLVATLGAHQWLAVGYRDRLASTALQLEPGLRVQAIDPCVIDDVAGLPQLQIDHPGPIASMSLRQVNDPIPDDRIAIGPWHVPEG